MKPPIPYYGAKGRLAPWIASLLPPHRLYVEPFCGSAAVLFAKPPSQYEVINDIDNNVITFFRMLRERPEELVRACQLTPYARTEYRAARLDEDVDDLERARRVFVRATQAFNGDGLSAGRSGSWSSGARPGDSYVPRVRARADRLYEVAGRLRGVLIEYKDALDLIPAYDGPDAAFYVDPPYLRSTRSSLHLGDRRRSDYRHDMPDEDDHRVLAKVLTGLDGAVLLSGYDSELYRELYAGWWQASVAVTRPTTNRAGGTASSAVEVVWSNRPLALQDDLFGGAA